MSYIIRSSWFFEEKKFNNRKLDDDEDYLIAILEFYLPGNL